jgi:hypothetical protein
MFVLMFLPIADTLPFFIGLFGRQDLFGATGPNSLSHHDYSL